MLLPVIVIILCSIVLRGIRSNGVINVWRMCISRSPKSQYISLLSLSSCVYVCVPSSSTVDGRHHSRCRFVYVLISFRVLFRCQQNIIICGTHEPERNTRLFTQHIHSVSFDFLLCTWCVWQVVSPKFFKEKKSEEKIRKLIQVCRQSWRKVQLNFVTSKNK